MQLGVSIYKCTIESFGYIATFQYIDYLTILAAFIGATSLSVSTQILSRLLLGLVVGLNTIIIPVYLTSCLPGSMGGPAGTLNQLFITIGILLGYLIGFTVFDSTIQGMSWRFLIALPILPALIRIYTTRNIFPYFDFDLDMKVWSIWFKKEMTNYLLNISTTYGRMLHLKNSKILEKLQTKINRQKQPLF